MHVDLIVVNKIVYKYTNLKIWSSDSDLSINVNFTCQSYLTKLDSYIVSMQKNALLLCDLFKIHRLSFTFTEAE